MTRRDADDVARWIGAELPLPPDLAHVLPQLLDRLLEEDALSGVCVEEAVTQAKTNWQLAALGLSGFLSDRSTSAYLADPAPWFALTLLAASAASSNGFLPYPEIARANTADGLNLFPFLWLQRPIDPATPRGRDLAMLGQQTFIRYHRGYRLKSIIKEVPAAMEPIFTGGGLNRRAMIPAGSATTFPGLHSDHDRVVLGLSREESERALPGPAITWLFGNARPICRFTRAEQQVLQCAVDALTDREIAAALGVSPNGIKDRWRSIFDRVLRSAPHVLPADVDEPERAGRGPEKRRPLLQYLEDHPEELRPYAS